MGKETKNKKSKTITITLDEFSFKKLDHMCLKQNRNRSNMIEYLIRDVK